MGRKPTGNPPGRPPIDKDLKVRKIQISISPTILTTLDRITANAGDASRSATIERLIQENAPGRKNTSETRRVV